MKVPFLDLKAQYASIKTDIDNAIDEIIANTAFIGGQTVKNFNKNFAGFIGTDFCTGVGNGTDALVIALKALGVTNGDEVITAANSFIATSEAITAAGGKVVFVDCHPDYYNLDPAKLEEKITDKTKVIIPVHLYGQPADMEAIVKIAKKYNLKILEDSAQAHGAKFAGQKIGTLGDVATFSFYPGKNLGAYGDAGAVVTSNPSLGKWIQMYANHGRIDKYNHEFEGINSRIDSLQAAILSHKIEHIDNWNKGRQKIAAIYDELLKDIPQLVIPKIHPKAESVYHLYVVRAENREGLKEHLTKKEISTGIHYPIGLPYLQAYDYLKHTKEDFPVTYAYQNKLLSLPIYAEMTTEMAEYVAKSIREFYN